MNYIDEALFPPPQTAQYALAGIMRKAIENGANVNVRDPFGKTPLHAAVEADAFDAAEVLLAAGARTDSMDNRGHWIVQTAVWFSEPALIRLLFEHGAQWPVGQGYDDDLLDAMRRAGRDDEEVAELETWWRTRRRLKLMQGVSVDDETPAPSL